MSGFKGIFLGKNSNEGIAREMAKDYQKKATKAFKQYLKAFPDAKYFTGFAVPVESLNYRDRTVEINYDPEKEIFKTKCKSVEEIEATKEFISKDDLQMNGYWFAGRSYEEIQLLEKALRDYKFTPMWKLDAERFNYILYPVFFVK